ncbi:MAG: hypothetical protein HOM47_02775 [Euryarchaeota archaeon]|jgi:hypothetical protein|nr:hypothetical protein [Euryarchaeota archaeon]MBT5184080.1 hypothetical protein [Euryarchaeota archaeon]
MRVDISIVIFMLSLAVFLALSPMLLFSHSNQESQITSEDLSQPQRDALEAGPFTKPGQEDGISLTGALLIDGDLFIAGEFTGNHKLSNYSLDSEGSSDLMVARLDANGSWNWIVTLGGEGIDSSITLELVDGRISVRGAIFGEVEFGNWTIGDNDTAGNQAFVGDIYAENGDWRTAQIDPYGDLSSDPALWCGW